MIIRIRAPRLVFRPHTLGQRRGPGRPSLKRITPLFPLHERAHSQGFKGCAGRLPSLDRTTNFCPSWLRDTWFHWELFVSSWSPGGCQGQMQFSLVCSVLVQQCLTEVIEMIPLATDSHREEIILRVFLRQVARACQGPPPGHFLVVVHAINIISLTT